MAMSGDQVNAPDAHASRTPSHSRHAGSAGTEMPLSDTSSDLATGLAASHLPSRAAATGWAVALQQSAGNSALGQWLDRSPLTLQRDDAAPTGNAAPAQGGQPADGEASVATFKLPSHYWPLGGGAAPVAARAEAATYVRWVAVVLRQRGEDLGDEAQSVFEDLAAQTQARADQLGDGTLTAEDVAALNEFITGVDGKAEATSRAILERFAAQIASFVSDDVQAQIDESADALLDGMAEQAHQAFIGTNQDDLKAIGDVIDKAKALSSKVGEIVGKVHEIADYAKEMSAAAGKVSEFAGRVKDLNAKIGEQIGKAKEVYGLAHTLATATQLTNRSNGTAMMSGIQAFESGFKLADTVVGKLATNVPLFGKLWSEYYKPLTEMCIKQLRIIAKADEREGRELQVYFLMEGSSVSRDASGAPLLNPMIASQGYFPGGQAVFSYMWLLREGRAPALNGAVKEYFIAREDIFNAFPGEDDKLTDDWELFDPSTWSRAGRITNLDGWLARHAAEVWAMLYGDLGAYIPH
jgi:methyl-accepting chemotaxis protein